MQDLRVWQHLFERIEGFEYLRVNQVNKMRVKK